MTDLLLTLVLVAITIGTLAAAFTGLLAILFIITSTPLDANLHWLGLAYGVFTYVVWYNQYEDTTPVV